MKVLLVPVIKKKILVASHSSIYKPLALLAAASKVFDLILHSGVSPYNYTFDARFHPMRSMVLGQLFFNLLWCKNRFNFRIICERVLLNASKTFDLMNHKKFILV